MIKVFIPESKGRIKTSVRGFWRNEAGRTYYDYLKIVNGDVFYLADYKKRYNQEAIFYASDNIGYIYYNKDKIEVLPHRIYKEVLRQDLKVAIKEALTRFSGCTIYIEAGRYYIEVFTTI